MCGIERQFREPRSLARRKAVMRYDEKEEIELTGEWLLRISNAGFSEELMYVPSQLTKLGVAPIDVADRLRKSDQAATVDQEVAAVAISVFVPEMEDGLISPVDETVGLKLDYDGYGAWEWAEPIEKMVEDAIFAIFSPDPKLPNFNQLISVAKTRQRSRGKRARAASANVTP